MYKLQLFDVADSVQPIDARLFAEGSMTIGRDPRANWAIHDPDCIISRQHCELFARSDGLAMTVAGSGGVILVSSGERLPHGEQTLLPLPCSLELGPFRLVASKAPFGGEPIDPSMTLLMTPPVGTSADVPSDWEDAGPAPNVASGSLLESFCRGAGIDSSLLSADDPEEIMLRVGAIYRQMVLGIGDLMAERTRARGQYEMSRTTISGQENNPFKWAPTQRLAIDLLISGPSSFLPGPLAVRGSFLDLKRHLIASFAGLKGALQNAVETFSPKDLDHAVPDRPSLLRNRAAAQLAEVRRRHQELLAQLEDGRQGSLDRAFASAYDAADAQAKADQL